LFLLFDRLPVFYIFKSFHQDLCSFTSILIFFDWSSCSRTMYYEIFIEFILFCFQISATNDHSEKVWMSRLSVPSTCSPDDQSCRQLSGTHKEGDYKIQLLFFFSISWFCRLVFQTLTRFWIRICFIYLLLEIRALSIRLYFLIFTDYYTSSKPWQSDLNHFLSRSKLVVPTAEV